MPTWEVADEGLLVVRGALPLLGDVGVLLRVVHRASGGGIAFVHTYFCANGGFLSYETSKFTGVSISYFHGG